MSFWLLQHDQGRPALIDETSGNRFSYGELAACVQQFARQWPSSEGKKLGFILCRNEWEPIVAYLASLQAGHAVSLLSDSIHPDLLQVLLEQYKPDWIFAPNEIGLDATYERANLSERYTMWNRLSSEQSKTGIHEQLAVLLSTSGTTGSPKLVRLSHRNIQANAESIAQYLGLTPLERPITTLPMQYSYGLSVINSHLQAGATLLLTNHSVTNKQFWDFFRAHEATSLAGVPFIYQLFERLRLQNLDLPSLRTLTQAGGRLDTRLVKHFHQLAREKQWRFFVMYGQTEATARMSYVPYEQLDGKEDSIGMAIPQGKLSIDEATGELIYHGPNVMMGYANNRDDLQKADELHGVLHTGDLAKQDADGYFYITGRLKRFIKLFGLRINLDEVERALESTVPVQVVCVGNDQKLVIVLEDEQYSQQVKQAAIEMFQLHASGIQVQVVPSIIRTPAGKVDYPKMAERVM
ncbi:AMP-binding protein [Brevibacillus fulvus]|uniref:Acyl-CoA synthetase (AMP-forming)/AMP-acid ligase II n=1 Tax=Brevibacillus fulvus TaxID=1125967 RepID=A0A939BT61_9BACL|nr:AMP-binding protein [Brevibacillus fulvus]MBM7591482.1 acyl-CoA synthetase (AMP-forming)/AMP-acid ligase II [Brevibacillus fulvus]